jgi:hypothetical protein
VTSTAFTCRSARSAAVLALLLMLLVLETVTLHLLLFRFVPILAYTVSALSVTLLIWLVADYRAMGNEALRLDPTHLHVRVGLRLAANIPRTEITAVSSPTWLDLRAEAPPYLNATKPATPNLLFVFREPRPIRVVGLHTRRVARLALHLDDPAAFLSAWGHDAEREGD